MKNYGLSSLKITNSNVFRYAYSLKRYIFPVEIAEEAFCNYVSHREYGKVEEFLKSKNEIFLKHYSERDEINSAKRDFSRYLHEMYADDKRASVSSFEEKVHNFCIAHSYYIEKISIVFKSIEQEFNKDEYLLDWKDVSDACLNYGDKQIKKIDRASQEEIVLECAESVTKYFCLLCIVEELEDMGCITDEIKERIVKTKFSWESDISSGLTTGTDFLDDGIRHLWRCYCNACKERGIDRKLLDDFKGKYPKGIEDIFAFNIPARFFEEEYANLSNIEQLEVRNKSINAYRNNDDSEIRDILDRYQENYSKVPFNGLMRFFAHFMVHKLYPPFLAFEREMNEEGEIFITSENVCKRGKNVLDSNVGEFFACYDYRRAFESKEETEKDITSFELCVEADELKKLVRRVKLLISEFSDQPYIPPCDIVRLNQVVIGIEREIEEEERKRSGKVLYCFFEATKASLITMEEENRLAFLQYKNSYDENKEVSFSDSTSLEDFDSKIATIDTEEISTKEASLVLKSGMRELINTRFIQDLKKIREFVVDNNYEGDFKEILSIAEEAYKTDEIDVEKFHRWFEERLPDILDEISVLKFKNLNREKND